jgi:uncharacterized membrane protein (DUF2068 family)
MADKPGKPESSAEVPFLKKRAPTLYVIIAIKLIKGALLLLLAVGVYRMSGRDLPEMFRQVLEFFHFDPERRFFVNLAEGIEKVSKAKMVWLSLGTFIYSLFSLVEGIGLIFRVPWAGWLAIGESAFFIPIEVFELVKRPSLALLAVLVINIFIVWYLFQNRQRLFRHHHH